MQLEKRLQLIREVGEEILTEDELKKLLEEKAHPVAYDGFEPSGNMHIAQAVLRVITINKMTRAGCKFILWEADWHAWINNKMGGDLDKIHTVAEYFEEIWKAAGMDMENVKFVSATEVVDDQSYWKKIIQVAQQTTVQRMMRCGQIMGRDDQEMQRVAQLMYPAMQAADVEHLGVDICQLGMDQRKVNILLREVAPKLGWNKPVAVHHRMLAGLSQPPKEGEGVDRAIAMKMSKSKPQNSIFVTDTVEEVTKKIGNAWCPPEENENPVLEYLKHMVFEKQKEVNIERPAKYGGNQSFGSYTELKEAYLAKKIHPQDLKTMTAVEVNKLLEPIRKHFTKGKPAELLKAVLSYEVTR
ncbi:MAG: tyrosine--tRNA ligase [Candidatus Woesearchaeota archaeon]|jgi:tyrosyl-tRNA synthetase|nr:tyrosine--tRNA ligase [Candidatus Woesearchaeota archaeon]MDP7180910.1 tyrosine--tRNA ligase [Candidatus Woesearchaeota archaeon]MDP7199153.1 tyrosine--tRNA ligase [Candidatus Woesearchaeota archaeon]MDP7467584.1 tyrosine--tRNA ligase [Candidatus Woesearchaeota archaeon]MDP7647066.1 tyrosine--tRNA ligase [Candidatus Woesearchaeota archaeon]